MWKIYKFFLILLPWEKVHWTGINALKLMGNRHNIFVKDPHSLRKKLMTNFKILLYLEYWMKIQNIIIILYNNI